MYEVHCVYSRARCNASKLHLNMGNLQPLENNLSLKNKKLLFYISVVVCFAEPSFICFLMLFSTF